MSDDDKRDLEADRKREHSWLGRTILPPREGEHWLVRELKVFARTGLVVGLIFLLAWAGRAQGGW